MAEVRIPFKKLLDSTIKADYDALTDTYTLKANNSWWVNIAFKKLLDSTVVADYDALTDSYTLKVNL